MDSNEKPSIFNTASFHESVGENKITPIVESDQEMKTQALHPIFGSNPIAPLLEKWAEKSIDELENRKPKMNPWLYFVLSPYWLIKRVYKFIDNIFFVVTFFVYSLFRQVNIGATIARLIINPNRAKRLKDLRYIFILKIIFELITVTVISIWWIRIK